MDTVDVILSETDTDPKQLRKLRQQQLQQKFRREMEAKKLEQTKDPVKSEDAEVAVRQGSTGGLTFMCTVAASHSNYLGATGQMAGKSH